MSDPVHEAAAPRGSKIEDFVENSIRSIVEFGLRYVYTAWTFLRWPFKPSVDILQSEARTRTCPPLSFLFVSSSLFYFAGELFMKILQIGRKWKPDPVNASPFSDISWNAYSIDAFALYTAPIIVIVIVSAKICGWAISRGPATRKNAQAMILYLSGYILLILSAASAIFVVAVTEILPGLYEQTGNGPSTVHLSKILLYLFFVLLGYASVSILDILVLFSRAEPASGEKMRRFSGSAIVRFLAMSVGIILCIPSGIAGTNYLILKNMRSASDIDLSGVMIVTNDPDVLARGELPLSVALTNTSEKVVVLFLFKEMNATIEAVGKPDQSLRYKFAPRSVTGKFLELKPQNAAIIDGVLLNHDAQRRLWFNDRIASGVGITLSFLGGYQKENPVTDFKVTAVNRMVKARHGGLILSGFGGRGPVAARPGRGIGLSATRKQQANSNESIGPGLSGPGGIP